MIARDQRSDARLLLEALAQLHVRDELAVHQLQRAELACGYLLHHVDRAHAACAERPLDSVVASEDRAGFQLELLPHGARVSPFAAPLRRLTSRGHRRPDA